MCVFWGFVMVVCFRWTVAADTRMSRTAMRTTGKEENAPTSPCDGE